jgi:hypothetical protein
MQKENEGIAKGDVRRNIGKILVSAVVKRLEGLSKGRKRRIIRIVDDSILFFMRREGALACRFGSGHMPRQIHRVVRASGVAIVRAAERRMPGLSGKRIVKFSRQPGISRIDVGAKRVGICVIPRFAIAKPK